MLNRFTLLAGSTLLCIVAMGQLPAGNLDLWLRADAGVQSAGGLVSQWDDQSGNGRHAVNSFGAPLYVPNVVNGLPVLRFNGSSNGLATPAFTPFPNKRGCMFVVVKINGPSLTSGVGSSHICGTWYSPGGISMEFAATTANYGYFDGVGTVGFNVAPLPPNAWGIVTLHRNTDTSFDFYKSGILATTSTVANNQPSSLPQHIGYSGYPGISEVLNGDLAEVIFYGRSLSPAEIEQVNTYLANKYYFNGNVPLPTASGVTLCGPGSTTLTASNGSAYRWFDSPTATVPLSTDASFVTPVLNASTTYYVANYDGQLQSQRVAVEVTVNLPGSACDDNNAATENDALDANCVCLGTPINPCTTDLDIIFQPDGVSDIGWELREQGTNILVQSGSGIYPASPGYSLATCLPDGCFYLVVTDDGGDGITNGGYQLRVNSSGRLIDNLRDAFGNGGFNYGSVSQIAGGEGFCLPLGSDRLIYTSCDKMDWKTSPCSGEYVYANDNDLVSAEFGVNDANSGYQMWWFDPKGGYSFKRFQSHSTSNGLPASATRACGFKLNSWVGNQLAPNVLYNVKVRGRVNGTYLPWGAACRLMVDNTAAQCPRTKLMDIPGSQYLSCGTIRPVATNAYVHARPVRRMNNNCNWVNANRYQFRFRIVAENVNIVRTSQSGQYWVNTNGLSCGKTYEVDVRASFDNGTTWCNMGGAGLNDPAWGDVCMLSTSNCFVGGSQNIGLQGTGVTGELRMYPNPNRGDQLFINLTQVEEGVSTVSVDIYDGFGKRVAARTIAVQDGFVNSGLELNGDLATGLYVVNITAGSQVHTERLVIQP